MQNYILLTLVKVLLVDPVAKIAEIMINVVKKLPSFNTNIYCKLQCYYMLKLLKNLHT